MIIILRTDKICKTCSFSVRHYCAYQLHGHSGDVDFLQGLHIWTVFFSLLSFEIAKSTVCRKTLQQKRENIRIRSK